MAGPLVRVKTVTAAIGLNVNRALNMGKDTQLNFIVPDSNEPSEWRTLLAFTKDFDRVTPSEETRGDARDIIFRVADIQGFVGAIIRTKDLHVELVIDGNGTIYPIDDVPQLAPNVAQVYDITCKSRTLRRKYFDTSG